MSILCFVSGRGFLRRRAIVFLCDCFGHARKSHYEEILRYANVRAAVQLADGELAAGLIHQSFTSLALLIATFLVASFFAYIYSIKRQNYLLLWTAAWLVFGVHYISPAMTQSAVSSALEGALTQWLFGLSALLFFLGAQIYAQRRCWKRRALAAAAVLGIWAGANAVYRFPVSAVIPASLLYVGVAAIFWQESRRQETLADRLLGLSFASWGILWLALHFLKATPELQGPSMSVVATAPCAFVAMLMVMALYEEEKRRIERNMLALSNLNLATSSFVGGEIQRMLSQALDRVLGVVRLPAGALFLHHGDPQGPTSVVAVGLSDEFCRAAQNESLDDYLVSLVARLGGLLGFRDLRDDSLSALEKEKSIRRFRELALAQGLRSVVAISLQAKEQAFGVLLLGTPDNRRFTSAELRLLLALGHRRHGGVLRPRARLRRRSPRAAPRAGQRSQHRYRKRAPLLRGAHQGAALVPAQHHLAQRHRHAESRRDARQNHRAVGGRPHLRPHRHRLAGLRHARNRHPGRSRHAPWHAQPAHPTRHRARWPRCPQRSHGRFPRGLFERRRLEAAFAGFDSSHRSPGFLRRAASRHSIHRVRHARGLFRGRSPAAPHPCRPHRRRTA